MTIHEWLIYAQTQLPKSTTPRLDAEVLLCDSLQTDKAWLFAHDETELSDDSAKDLNKVLQKRANGTPLAYIRGRAPFYGREFIVNSNVLIPRPETEKLIDATITIVREEFQTTLCKIADVGTGSGAIGITLACELKNVGVFCLDISKEALNVASHNAREVGADVQIIKSDLLDDFDAEIDILCANLPYVPDDYSINIDAGHEPPLALFGGVDGLDLYRRMFGQLAILENRPRFVLTESLPISHESLGKIAKESDYTVRSTHDLVQVFVPIN